MVGSIHNVEDAVNVLSRNVFMKQVTHRVNEYGLWIGPPLWKPKHTRLLSQPETVSVIRLSHCLQAVGHPFRVTVVAARTDSGATGDRVPRRFCPLNRRFFPHQISSCVGNVTLTFSLKVPFRLSEAGGSV